MLATSDEETKYQNYWTSTNDPELLKKVTPMKVHLSRRDGALRPFVVKSFRPEKYKDKDDLPYMPMPARESIDVWSFGVMLYEVLNGTPLFAHNKDSDLDIQHDTLLPFPGIITDTLLEKIIIGKRVKHKTRSSNADEKDEQKKLLGQHLLLKILKVLPDDRPSIEEILQEPFFNDDAKVQSKEEEVVKILQELDKKMNDVNGKIDSQKEILIAINERTIKIHDMSTRMFDQMKNTEKLLLRAIYEVIVVTCVLFICSLP